MRLWHYELIPYLPKSQLWLLAQWRELNSIYKKQDNHILINYIYNYSKDYLLEYSNLVIDEFENRGYKIRSLDNYNCYFKELVGETVDMNLLIYPEHNDEYLKICYYNLYEKYLRGQKDFSKEQFGKLKEFIEN